MSAALLKKSLELCDAPFEVLKEQEQIRYKSVKGKAVTRKTQRGIADVQRKNVACIEEVKKKRKLQKTKEKSIRRKLEILKKSVIDEKLAKKILESTKKRGASDRDIIYLVDKPEEQSAFTEEDFERFAKEYTDDS